MKRRNPAAPAGLSAEARRLWKDIQSEYQIDDAGGLRLLRTCCEALDQMRRAEAAVKAEGATYRDRYGGLKPHPLLGTVRDSRAAMMKSMQLMNLDLEPLRSGPGRPPGR